MIQRLFDICFISSVSEFIKPFKYSPIFKFWWAHLGSNQGPIGYEPMALPAELWAPNENSC